MTVPGFISSYVDVEGRRGDEAQADKGKQQLMMEDLMEDEGLIKYLMNCFVGSYWEVRRQRRKKEKEEEGGKERVSIPQGSRSTYVPSLSFR
jgi:hypothetical protein